MKLKNASLARLLEELIQRAVVELVEQLLAARGDSLMQKARDTRVSRWGRVRRCWCYANESELADERPPGAPPGGGCPRAG